MKLTIAICTHNRSNLLSKTITSINKAIIPKSLDIEIFVIANACSDTTIDYLYEYQKNQNHLKLLSLIFTEEPRPGKSYSLNKALSLITNGWICFVDDDHRIDSEYIKNINVAIHTHPNCRMFCGKIIPDWKGNEPKWVHDQGAYKITPYPIPYFDLGNSETIIMENASLPGGGNLIINTEVFRDIGTFAEDLGPKGHNLMGSEDSDFVLRALRQQNTIIYIPDIIQYHYVDPQNLKLKYLLKKSYQRNRSITLAHSPSRTFPPNYLWLTSLKYVIAIFFNKNFNITRYYLTKLAGIIGQIAGYIQTR